MKKIKGPWTYRTAVTTIHYGSGSHEVADEIALAKESEDANRVATPSAPNDSDAA